MKHFLSLPRPAMRLLVLAFAATLVAGGSLFAQYQTGNIFGTILDPQGLALPGVSVTLTGMAAPQTFQTDSQGQFRFLNLSPGSYDLSAELAGMGTGSRSNVRVSVGSNTEVRLSLSPALEQTITVTAESPLLDVRKMGTGATVDQVELEQIPSARDPWVILQQVPGVLVDRINVGGNESGQQSNYTAKGIDGSQATWNVDGVNITDMAATGSSPGYYDFDAFEEMQVTTGGTDPRIQTAGVQLNMVTKRGTNEWSGSGRFLTTDKEYQSDPEVPTEAAAYLGRANEVNHIEDFGGELGGPIIRDHLWVWGAYGKQEIQLFTAQPVGGVRYRDDTFLTNANAKLNAQIVSNNSATVFYSEGAKEKFGRNVSPTRPPETGWNQGNIGGGTITNGSPLWKIEDTHIFSPNFYLTALYSDIKGGFFLTPVGGREQEDEVFLNAAGVWQRSFVHYESERPQQNLRVDGSAFLDVGPANNELKFGFGYRDTPTTSLSAWPGRGNWGFIFDDAENFGLAYLTRSSAANYGTEYTDIYVGDTILMRNLTVQVGLRYDMQQGANFASTVAANPLVPDLLPSATFEGDAENLEWKTISPRIGATYTFGTTRRTLLRAAYNIYADQMGAGDVGFGHPFVYIQALSYYWEDANADRFITRNEILFEDGLYGFYGLDPDKPGSPLSPTRIDYDMDVPTTNEIILGGELELRPEFTVGVNYTRRLKQDYTTTRFEKTRGQRDFYTSADYVFLRNVTGTLPNGQTYSEPVYRLKPGIDPPTFGVLTNRADYEQEFNGIELFATKRLSNRWMMRGNFSFNDWTQNVGDEAFTDPTRIRTSLGCSNCDGELVTEGSGTGSGAKGNVFINSRYSFNITGLYQFPWAITFGAAVTGREGYPLPYYHRINPGDGTGSKFVLATDSVDEFRTEDVASLDLRLAKEFHLGSRVGLTISLEGFNVLDERTILQRETRLSTSATRINPAANRITEIMSPQLFRLGARLTF